MCRQNISLFELRDATNNSSFIVERNTDVSTWPIVNGEYQQRLLGRKTSDHVKILEMVARQGPFEGCGITFQFSGNTPSIYFMESLYSCNREDLENEKTETLDSVYFDRFHFHQETMTFHGAIHHSHPLTQKKPQKESSYQSNDEQRVCHMSYLYQNLEVVLQFSPDARYIRDGYLSWTYFDSALAEHFPLDGTWEVEYESGERGILHVQLHFFSFFGLRYHIHINSKDNHAWFHWPDHLVIQTSNEKIEPGSSGPCIGETLNWTTNSGDFIKWNRVSMNLSGVSKVVRMKPAQFVYQRVNTTSANDSSLVPTYHLDTLWGNTFCQAFTVGLASYHFVKSEESCGYQAYISYENPKTAQWPNLDNGEAIPSRVLFRNVQWNSQTRTFTGEILWMQDYGTTWTGDSKWSYEIKFDPLFRFVISGTCTMANREPHQFGKDLVYINAALETVFAEALESNPSTGEYIDMLRECRQDGASEATLQCLGEVAMNRLHGGESCFDFNL